MKKNIIQIDKKGFTLLEMIVSMGIFTIVAVIAVGSLVRITSLNRQAQSMQAAMNNINYILESMSREMRYGSSFHCSNSLNYNQGPNLSSKECVGNDNDKAILFKSAKTSSDSNGSCNLVYAYWFIEDNDNNWDIKKSQQTSCSQDLSADDAYSLVDLSNATITDINFDVKEGNLGYSRASINIEGYSGIKENEKNYFDIKTAVTRRIKD